MVPPDWEHPRDKRGHHVPLFARSELEDREGLTEGDVMPDFGDRATHMRMYETVTEGTPMSPAFATAEELARWLADTKASAFGYTAATYEQWLALIERGSGGGLVIDGRTGAQRPAMPRREGEA